MSSEEVTPHPRPPPPPPPLPQGERGEGRNEGEVICGGRMSGLVDLDDGEEFVLFRGRGRKNG